MGDRANVAVVMDHSESGVLDIVYLYTHWGGSNLPEVVQRALAKRWRWNDESYLARIIFDTMTEGCHGSETGFGISTYRPDNEHSIIVVAPWAQSVGFSREGQEPDCYRQWSFEQFIAASLAEINSAYCEPEN